MKTTIRKHFAVIVRRENRENWTGFARCWPRYDKPQGIKCWALSCLWPLSRKDLISFHEWHFPMSPDEARPQWLVESAFAITYVAFMHGRCQPASVCRRRFYMYRLSLPAGQHAVAMIVRVLSNCKRVVKGMGPPGMGIRQ